MNPKKEGVRGMTPLGPTLEPTEHLGVRQLSSTASTHGPPRAPFDATLDLDRGLSEEPTTRY